MGWKRIDVWKLKRREKKKKRNLAVVQLGLMCLVEGISTSKMKNFK